MGKLPMETIILFKLGSLFAFIGVVLVVLVFLLKRSRLPGEASAISIDDLFLETGPSGQRISKVAVITFWSLVATTWVLVYKTVAGDDINTLFAAYVAAWVIPFSAVILKGNGHKPPEVSK